jgi:hypothetical protein
MANRQRTTNNIQSTIQQHEPHYKPGVNSGVPEEYAGPAPHVAPVVLLRCISNQTTQKQQPMYINFTNVAYGKWIEKVNSFPFDHKLFVICLNLDMNIK